MTAARVGRFGLSASAAAASEPVVVCAKLVESTRIDEQMPAAEETSWRTEE
jgi:hypothetical protein